ncbi:MAG: VanZ family protein [Candidatus Scatosoma sp.]
MVNERKKRITLTVIRALLTTVTAAYLCWIFSNSLKNAQQSSEASGKVQAVLQAVADKLAGEGKIVISARFIRKSAHFSEFALLSFLVFFTSYSYLCFKPHATAIGLGYAAGVALVCGAADETVQIFAEGRAPSVFDAMIDFSGGVAGAFCALLLFVIVRSIVKKRKARKTGKSGETSENNAEIKGNTENQ